MQYYALGLLQTKKRRAKDEKKRKQIEELKVKTEQLSRKRQREECRERCRMHDKLKKKIRRNIMQRADEHA